MEVEKKVSLKDSLKEKLERVMTVPLDPELESQMVDWIEEVTGEHRGTLTTTNWLKNGKILCALLNRIQPNAVKIRRSLVPTDKLENIQKFIGVVKTLGVPVFDPFDLFDGTDMTKVLQCVSALKELAPKELPVAPQASGMSQQVSIKIDANMVASIGPDNGDAGDKNPNPFPTGQFLPSTGNFAGPVSPSGGIIVFADPEPEPQTKAKEVDLAPPLKQGTHGSKSTDSAGNKPRPEQDNVAGNCCASCVLQ